MGFTLRITNAPSGATRWHADFAARTFDYDPIADSGWPGIAEVWDYPSDPRGATTLRIMIIDARNNILLSVSNLGPVNNGVDYEFNASTRKLIAAAVEPPPIVTLAWIGSIFSFVWDISDWFLSAYQEVSGWIWPFYYLQYPLYGLYRVCRDLLTPIAHFWEWADDVWSKVQQIFSLAQITAYFRTWIDYATAAWDWVKGAFGNVWFIINDWWSSAKYVVLAWIDTAIRIAFELKDDFFERLGKVGEDWDKFKTMIPSISEVIDWFKNWGPKVMTVITPWWVGALLDVAGLINSSFTEREGFWAGWQDFRDLVADFFANPLDFVKSHVIEPIIDDFNKGFDRGMKGEEKK